jgi:hypothetical protein
MGSTTPRRRVAIDDEPAISYGITAEEERALRAHDDDAYDDDVCAERSVADVWAWWDDTWAAYDNTGDDGYDEAWTALVQELLDLGESLDAIMARAGRRTRDVSPGRPSATAPGYDRGRGSLERDMRRGRVRHGLGGHGEAVLPVESDGPDRVRLVPRRYGDDSRMATQWLRQHDPLRRREGVTEAVNGALRDAGLSREDVRAALASGRPTKDRKALRARLRAALEPVKAAKREWLADELGCSTKALQLLLKH